MKNSKTGSGKVLISTSSFAEFDKQPIELLKKHGYDVVLNPHGRKLKESELLELADACVGIVAGTEQYNEQVLAKLCNAPEAGSRNNSSVVRPELKVISRCGAGMDNVNLDVAKKYDVVVRNTPDAPTEAVAELALALMLDLSRSISYISTKTRIGTWNKIMGHLIQGKTVGIVGCGRIGRRVAELLKPFGVKILAYDIKNDEKWAKANGVIYSDIDNLLKESDIISLHVPHSPETVKTINKEKLAKMKKGALIVNTSRGGVIDEAAVYDALKSGKVGGVALDVTEMEPYTGPLKDLPNVIITPHIGSYAIETRISMELEAVKNLLAALE